MWRRAAATIQMIAAARKMAMQITTLAPVGRLLRRTAWLTAAAPAPARAPSKRPSGIRSNGRITSSFCDQGLTRSHCTRPGLAPPIGSGAKPGGPAGPGGGGG